MAKILDSPDILTAAQIYINKGWHVVPLQDRTKNPAIEDWLRKRISLSELNHYFSTQSNIGIALGDASNGLVDLDFDSLESYVIGNKLFSHLPGFGRAAMPVSHRLAICPDPGKTKRFILSEEQAWLFLRKGKQQFIFELRSTDTYTMFPPSAYFGPQKLEWIQGMPEEIPVIEWDELVRKAGLCAFLSVILMACPRMSAETEKIFDMIFSLLAGSLLDSGLSGEEVDDIIAYIAEIKGGKDFLSAKGASSRAIRGNETILRLCNILGIPALESTLHRWLMDPHSVMY